MKHYRYALTVEAALSLFLLFVVLLIPFSVNAQSRESGPWWPSPHGPTDQAGASNYVTPEKILKALQIPQTGKTYELGHMYEASMPQFTSQLASQLY